MSMSGASRCTPALATRDVDAAEPLGQLSEHRDDLVFQRHVGRERHRRRFRIA
jgi:hypothetical protein